MSLTVILRACAPDGAALDTKNPAPGKVQRAFAPRAGPVLVSVAVQGVLAESQTVTLAVCVLAV